MLRSKISCDICGIEKESSLYSDSDWMAVHEKEDGHSEFSYTEY